MGRIMTLRGELDFQFGRSTGFGTGAEHELFSYTSIDRQRAWKVKFARVWVQELINQVGPDQRAVAQFTLATDTLGIRNADVTDIDTAKAWENLMGAGDNRTIGWLTTDYLNRDNTTADFLMQSYRAPDMLLDADRIVTNELYLSCYGLHEANSDIDTVINYYIELEEMKITPSESILQQLKGIGQDIGTQDITIAP